jgi:hypothetical protein
MWPVVAASFLPSHLGHVCTKLGLFFMTREVYI